MDLPFPPDPLAPVPPPPPPVAANPTPAPSSLHDHPPYPEMIAAAISALNEPNGSSKRAIAKYIETHYLNLPPAHSALLTNHLKRLKIAGQILMVKQSYKLPGSAPLGSVDANGAINPSAPFDPSSTAPKRRPGRPPKPKPDSIQAAVPVFATSTDINAVPPPNVDAAGGKVNGPPVRGRGRPPKRGGAKRGPGRPPKVGGVGGGARGRPRKNAILAARKKVLVGRPRGRPPKPVNVLQGLAAGGPVGTGIEAAPIALGGGIATVGVKRRGRPPKAGGIAKKPRNLPKMPRKLSGKPLGRPRKNQSKTSESQLLVAYLDLKAKLESLQSRVQQTAAFVKSSVNNEAAFNALQELELIALNISVPPTAPNQNQNQNQHQYQQPPPVLQPQPEQLHPQPPFPQSF